MLTGYGIPIKFRSARLRLSLTSPESAYPGPLFLSITFQDIAAGTCAALSHAAFSLFIHEFASSLPFFIENYAFFRENLRAPPRTGKTALWRWRGEGRGMEEGVHDFWGDFHRFFDFTLALLLSLFLKRRVKDGDPY